MRLTFTSTVTGFSKKRRKSSTLCQMKMPNAKMKISAQKILNHICVELATRPIPWAVVVSANSTRVPFTPFWGSATAGGGVGGFLMGGGGACWLFMPLSVSHITCHQTVLHSRAHLIRVLVLLAVYVERCKEVSIILQNFSPGPPGPL